MSDKGLLSDLAEIDYIESKLNGDDVSLPDDVSRIQEQIEAADNRLKSTKDSVILKQSDLRALEAELARYQELEKKYSTQILTVKTNKEYQLMQVEIAQTAERIGDTEEKILFLMEEIEAGESETATIIEKIENERQPLIEEIACIQKQMDNVKTRLIEIAQKRKSTIEQLSPGLRSEYERLHQRYNGEAVVPVIDGNCRGCFVNVVPQNVEKLYRADSIVRCESCGRFLYFQKSQIE